MKLVPENLNEIKNFTRDENNILKKLGIGLEVFIRQISSNDLEELAAYLDEGEEYYIENDLVGLKKEEVKKLLEKIKRLEIVLKDHILIGEMFDWKEESEMIKYINDIFNKNPKYNYVYNAMSDSDSYWVIFSDIKLPNAEGIDYDDYEEEDDF